MTVGYARKLIFPSVLAARIRDLFFILGKHPRKVSFSESCPVTLQKLLPRHKDPRSYLKFSDPRLMDTMHQSGRHEDHME